ncbi:MAG: SDR family oxidoreductase [Planctomycetota bacterium]|jgi:3-oxoacyl-[acyl-carrier protein] reductase|nr:SDR family oxidoreductase [Planctomycetota bacterium]
MEKKRVVLVTGAARGLGAAIARRLGKDGFRVAVNYCHSQNLADKVAQGIIAEGGEAKAFRADVTNLDDVKAMLAEIRNTWGSVEILVNNATGPQPERPLEEYSWQDFADQIDFFIKAPVYLMQELIAPMKQARWGKVINIGSEVTENYRPIFSPYIAAKSALLGLTRTWALEFGPWNIAINSIAPGWIPTERHSDAESADLEAYRAKVPMGRQGVPEDVASAASYLAREETNFISGQQFCVNGANTF